MSWLDLRDKWTPSAAQALATAEEALAHGNDALGTFVQAMLLRNLGRLRSSLLENYSKEGEPEMSGFAEQSGSEKPREDRATEVLAKPPRIHSSARLADEILAAVPVQGLLV